jgi:hypothetical protein
MVPTGAFDRLYCDIINRYDDMDVPVTFGILIADYQQTLAREYILNYLNIFDKHSGKYIDFFIPGYTIYDSGDGISTALKDKDGEKYYFSKELFDEFVEKCKKNFGFIYNYSPMLVLVELTRTDYINVRKIIIELDSKTHDIKKTGILFEKIFEIAKKYVMLDDFSREIVKTYIEGSALDSFVNALDNSVVTEIYNVIQNTRQYKIC